MEKDKTVKIRAYSEPARSETPKGSNATEGKARDLELALKDAQIEEEKSKSLENLKTIVQLRESLKQEQVKTAEAAKKVAELEAKIKGFASLEANELAKKNAQLEEEKKKSIEQAGTIEELKESLKQEQAKSAGAKNQSAELEARNKELAVLEAKIKDLSGALARIASIAETAKLAGQI